MTYLDGPPVALAHRGGARWAVNVGIENSLTAMRHAVDLGYRYLESDLRLSADGVVFAFHDPDLSRVAPGSGFGRTPFAALTSEQIRSVRLGAGEPIPTLAELLEAFPTAKLNLDVKTTEVIEPAIRVLAKADALDRVLIASFSHRRLRTVQRMVPGVATATSPWEILALRLGWRPLRAWAARAGAVAVQIPERHRGLRLVVSRLIRAAHDVGLQVHVWTVDDPADMHRLLDLGVDGLITDRPDLLKAVLVERGGWGRDQP